MSLPARLSDTKRRKKILAALRKGHSKHAAAATAGVSYSVFTVYRNKHVKFAEECELAVAQGLASYESLVFEAAQKEPAYAKVVLSTRFWQSWGQRKSDQITVTQASVLFNNLLGKIVDLLPIEDRHRAISLLNDTQGELEFRLGVDCED